MPYGSEKYKSIWAKILALKTSLAAVHVPDNAPIPGLQMNLLESYLRFFNSSKNTHQISKSNKKVIVIIRYQYTRLSNM